jgi:hypothetical protein
MPSLCNGPTLGRFLSESNDYGPLPHAKLTEIRNDGLNA